MNDGLAFVVSVLCLGTVFGAPAFLVGNLSADKPVSAAHWAKAEALCAINEGAATVSANTTDPALSHIDVICANKAVFEDVKP